MISWSVQFGAFWRPMSQAQCACWVEYLGKVLRGGVSDAEIDRGMELICKDARRDDPPPHVTDLFRAIVRLRAGERGESIADRKARFIADCRKRIDASMSAGDNEAAWNAICDGDQAHQEGMALQAYAETKGFDRGTAVAPMVAKFRESLRGMWRATA